MKRAIFLLGPLWLLATAWSQPVADFTANVQGGCAPLVVNFQNLSTGAVAYEWQFGNQSFSSLPHPGQFYPDPGSYDVQLIAIAADGSRDTVLKPGFIQVHEYPTANFRVNDSLVCAQQPIRFTDRTAAGAGQASEWFWDFGDGDTSRQQNPIHAYDQPGVYQVSLVVRNQYGCSDNLQKPGYIQVISPDASFFADQRLGCGPPLEVAFFPSNPVGQHFWDFGDGQTSTQPQPTHQYQQFGNFTVQHVVTQGGCSDTATRVNYVNLGVNTVRVWASDSTLCEGDSLRFYTNAPSSSQIVWHFGNGDSSLQRNPSYRYLQPGFYQVRAEITDPNGCDFSLPIPIRVHPRPHVDFGLTDTNVSCQLPFQVQFTDQSSNSVAYLWDLGDGHTAVAPNPTHAYLTPGKFSVSLTAWNAQGCSQTLTKPQYIHVEPLQASFGAEPFEGCAPLPVAFHDSSHSIFPIVSWQWDFGDGDSSTLPHPQHTYADTGYYDVSLIVENSDGCRDTLRREQYVSAGEKPQLAFTANTTEICAWSPVHFTNQSTGADRFLWLFGDGGSSNAVNPSKLFGGMGGLDVTLIGYDRGCPDTLIQPRYVHVLPPMPSISISEREICEVPATVEIENTSLLDDFWTFEVDGATYTSRKFTHTFTQPGTYAVRMQVGNHHSGCVVNATDVIKIMPIEPRLTTDTLHGCAPLEVNFDHQSRRIVSQSWLFGGADSVPTAQVARRFEEPGQYPVQLVLRNEIGCVDTVNVGPVVVRGPVAAMAVSDTGACTPANLRFSEVSLKTSPITQWRWSIDQQVFSLQPRPSHLFLSPKRYDVSLWVRDAEGCTDSVTYRDWLSITQPDADFMVIPPINCQDHQSTFISLSEGEGLSYLWDFGDGSSATQGGVTHSYADTGYYDVSLSVSDINGCRDSIAIPQAANIRNLRANFTADTTFATCPPLTVNFQPDTALPHANLEYYWDFGDGTFSTRPRPSKTYLLPGIYDVTLVVSTPEGCSDTLTMVQYIEVEGPRSDFTFDPGRGCPGTTVNFAATSPDPVTFEWVFGDGLTGTGPQTQHTYHQSGAYRPILVVIDNRGCRVFQMAQNPLQIFQPPEANFAADSIVCDAGPVTFFDRSRGRRVSQWFWDLGQGDTSHQAQPTATYHALGSYDITLMVEDERGCRDTLHRPDYVRVVESPEATVLPSDTAGCVDFLGQMQAQAAPHPYPIDQWHWDLGDGRQFDGPSLIDFTYTQPGLYLAAVTVSDANGCQDQARVNLEAWALPLATFTASDSFGCAPFPVSFQFNNLRPDVPITQWTWDLGDGTTSPERSPQHTYLTDSLYDVSLVLTDANGCVDTFRKAPYLHLDRPDADFMLSSQTLCPGEEVQLIDQSRTDTALYHWRWDLGDGQETKGPNPSHFYQQPGSYSVTLTVTDVFGCQDTATLTDAVQVIEDKLPNPVGIERVSVHSTREIEVEYTAFNDPEANFGAYLIFRAQDGVDYKEVGRVTDVAQLTYVDRVNSTEARSYCYRVQVVNRCGLGQSIASLTPHCTVELEPETTPGLEAVFLHWNPYRGWPAVDRYRVYRVDNYDPASAELIASLGGQDTAFTDWDMFCYEDYHYRVAAVNAAGKQSWSDVAYAAPDHRTPAEPTHISRVSVEDNAYLTVEWETPDIEFPVKMVLERSQGGAFQPVMEAPAREQQFKYVEEDIDVAQQQYSYRAFTLDTCGDFTPLGRIGQNMLLKVWQQRGQVVLQWTPYRHWEQGVDHYVVELYDSYQGRYQVMARVPGHRSELIGAEVLDQEDNCYRITAYEKDNNGAFSFSNEACIAPTPKVYRPNAFTPNGDGVNDVFTFQAAFVAEVHFVVYNRWGLAVFSADDLSTGWDGTDTQGRPLPTGTYTYYLRGRSLDGAWVDMGGTIQLIR